MKKHTKILATVGPASDSVEMLVGLIRAGVNVFRMNFSHGTHEYHKQVLDNIKEAEKITGFMTGVLQDISGPKIRVGMLEEDFRLVSGDRLIFVKEEITGKQTGENEYTLCINQPEILDSLNVGDAIYLYDGIIRAEVIERRGDQVVTELKNNGKLSSRKGVNFPNTRLGIDVLTPKDREDILWGIEHGVDFMAISFVQNAQDMLNARKILEENGGRQQLFAKIEKFDAVENIDAILEASDGLMVARGDLGIEVPYYEVPSIQKTLIKKANEASKPVITATQMLLSMTEKETATRAEISDVANAVLDGTDAVMLSEESAIGHNPVLAVETMTNTIRQIETIYPYQKFGYFTQYDTTDLIDESAVRLAHDLGTDAILAFTTSGQSAKKIARYRPACPIYAIIHDCTVARSLTIAWGILPAFFVHKDIFKAMMAEVVKSGLEKDVLSLEGTYMLTAGDPVGVPGTTNSLRILRKNELEYFNNL